MTAAEGFQGFARDRDLGVQSLSVRLLGGFRAERSEGPVPDFAWQRRGAKQLTKLLAISPGHALHREQIVETLWPRVGVDSARNSLAKSLYAARQALEPGRPPRRGSLYLQIRDDMIALNAEQVMIDSCGHVPQVECPEETNRLLTDFFAKAERGAAARAAKAAPQGDAASAAPDVEAA